MYILLYYACSKGGDCWTRPCFGKFWYDRIIVEPFMHVGREGIVGHGLVLESFGMTE